MNKSLLPPNAMREERDIEAAIARAGDIPEDTGKPWATNNNASTVPGKLWNPDTCPPKLLPWLAWALSVDDWDSSWSDDTKRDFIKQSAEIHRHKGTVGAVRQALASLGVSVDFLEWFDEVDDLALLPIRSQVPHTFVFIAWANENPHISFQALLTPELYATVRRVTGRVKPVRSHFDFFVGARMNNQMQIAAASTGPMQVGRFSNQTRPVQVPATRCAATIAMASSAPTQVGRFSNQTRPVQVSATQSRASAVLHLNQRRYAVARFYLIHNIDRPNL